MTPAVALIMLLTVVLLMATAILVAKARARYGVPAPATTGNPDFERVFRVQMNTLEVAVGFLPTLWLAASFGSARIAAWLGAVWLLGRVLYVAGYIKAADKRGMGFMIAGIAQMGLVALAGWGIGRAWLG